MLEATGRLQKCRLYEMCSNKAFRVQYLIVRDPVHEKVFAKALETLGVNWGKALPVPRIDTDKMPEVKDLENKNLHNIMRVCRIVLAPLHILRGRRYDRRASGSHQWPLR